MKIAIDARMMGPDATRGIGRYVEELVGAMLAIAPEHRYVLVTRTLTHRFVDHPSVETIVANVPWYGVAEQVRMPKVFAAIQADLVHVPHWNVPVRYHGPLIVTIHDLILRHTPDSAKISTRSAPARWIKRLGYRFVLGRAISHASKILVPTQYVAKDVGRFYPASRTKLCVTGEGMPGLEIRSVKPEDQEGSDHELRATSFAGNAPYLLYVGSAYPHKGLEDLLSAWQEIASAYPDLHLKIAGERDGFMQKIETSVTSQQLPRITFLGRVSDTDLKGLYEQAAGFVFPSHDEGFGLPPLEALAHGCPVLSSDAGPLPEVLGPDGAIFFRVGQPNAILAAVHTLMSDQETARRKAVSAARSLALRHSWTHAARATLDAYADACHFRSA